MRWPIDYVFGLGLLLTTIIAVRLYRFTRLAFLLFLGSGALGILIGLFLEAEGLALAGGIVRWSGILCTGWGVSRLLTIDGPRWRLLRRRVGLSALVRGAGALGAVAKSPAESPTRRAVWLYASIFLAYGVVTMIV